MLADCFFVRQNCGFVRVMAVGKRKKLIAWSVAVVITLAVLLVIVPYTVSAVVLDKVFGRRFETVDYLRFELSDFPELRAERHTFKSGENTLVGYTYSAVDTQPRATVILSHGFGGGGQNGYLDVSAYFVSKGYEVFAYDATGNDESPGEVGGLPQGIIDLLAAIAFVKTQSALPVVLFGHSWGGYSATCALSYAVDVKAVASVAGFTRSTDMIESKGVEYAGKISLTLLPYVKSVERIRFGDYASANGLDAVQKSNAGVFIAHGTADDVVPTKYGYDAYYSGFSGDSRFEFYKTDAGHAEILYSAEGWEYTQDLRRQTDGATSSAERQQVINAIDRRKFSSRLNIQMFDRISDFYERHI